MDNTVYSIKFAREAAYIERCHTSFKIGSYNIGFHSYNMLVMLRILNPDCSKNLIWHILQHDVPERFTGDIPAPAKWSGEVTHENLFLLENRINYQIFGNQVPLSTEEEKWLRSLDILELYLFCNDQINIGNIEFIEMKNRIYNYVIEKRSTFQNVLDIICAIQLGQIEWKRTNEG